MTIAGSASLGSRGGAVNTSSRSSEGDLGVFGGAIGGGESLVVLLLLLKTGELTSAAEDPTARATVEKGLRCGEPTKLTRDALGKTNASLIQKSSN